MLETCDVPGRWRRASAADFEGNKPRVGLLVEGLMLSGPRGRDQDDGEDVDGDTGRWVSWERYAEANDAGCGFDMDIRCGWIRVAVADSLSSPEPAPTDGEGPAIWSLVVADMKERDAFGREKYGKPLRAADGRKTLRDAYQEALDLAVYLRKAIYESEGR